MRLALPLERNIVQRHMVITVWLFPRFYNKLILADFKLILLISNVEMEIKEPRNFL